MSGTVFKISMKSTRRSSKHGPSTVDVAEARIRADIQNGRLTAGEHLTEASLTSRLGFSRGPIREAIKRLEADGVLDARLHRGVTVRKITRDDLVDILQVREFLEGLAARLMADRGVTSQTRSKLTGLNQKMHDAIEKDDVVRYNTVFYANFHEIIVAECGNPKLRRLWDLLHLKTFQIQLRPLIDLELVRKSHKEHKPLIDGILKRDPDAAESAMRRHIAHFIHHVKHLPDRLFDEE